MGAVGGGDHGVTAQGLELVDGFAAADDVEGLETIVPAEEDDHPPEGRARRRLEQPLPLGDGQDMPDHAPARWPG